LKKFFQPAPTGREKFWPDFALLRIFQKCSRTPKSLKTCQAFPDPLLNPTKNHLGVREKRVILYFQALFTIFSIFIKFLNNQQGRFDMEDRKFLKLTYRTEIEL